MSENNKTILLVRLDHAGDCVLTVPAVAEALRSDYPGSTIDVLVIPHVAPLLRDDPNINHVITYAAPWSLTPGGVPRYRRAVRYAMSFAAFIMRYWVRLWRRYDIIYCLSYSPWERLLTMPLGRRRVGFEGPYRNRLYRLSGKFLTSSVPFDETRHTAENCLRLIGHPDPIELRRFRNRLHMSAERRVQGRERIKEAGLDPDKVIAIHPSSDLSMKSWPMPGPMELGRTLSAGADKQVLFIMSPGDYTAIEHQLLEIEREHSNIRHLVTESFAELAQVLANVRLFVANDGGPMHIASALGVPTVAIFGPTDERLYAPLSPKSRVVRSGFVCGRKHKPWLVECACGGKACLADLTPGTVAEAVCELLKATEEASVATRQTGVS